MPPILEHGLPPPNQLGQLMSPVTPTQHPEPYMSKEQECLLYLDKSLNMRQDLINQQAIKINQQAIGMEKQCEKQKQLEYECERQGQSHAKQQHEQHERYLKDLRGWEENLMRSDALHEQELQGLREAHANILADARQDAEHRVRELEEEAVELNRTAEQEKDERDTEISDMKTEVTLLQEEASKTKAIAFALEKEKLDLQDEATRTTIIIGSLEKEKVGLQNERLELTQSLDTQSKDLEKHFAVHSTLQTEHGKLKAVNADLESKLGKAEQGSCELEQIVESLKTQKKIHQSLCESAEARLGEVEEEHKTCNVEIERLRKKSRQLEEADLAATALRNWIADTAKEHEARVEEVKGLKTDNKLLTTENNVSRETQVRQRKELEVATTDLCASREEVKAMEKTNHGLMDDLKTISNTLKAVKAALEAEKEVLITANKKRQHEQVSDG